MFGAVPCDLPDDVVRSQFGCASVIPRINYDTATSTPVGQNAPRRLCFVPASDAGYTGSTDPRTHILACRARCPTLTAELVVARCAITAPGPRNAPRSVPIVLWQCPAEVARSYLHRSLVASVLRALAKV